MQVDGNREKVFCTYCGTQIINLKDRLEITQNVNMSGTVRHVLDRSNEPNLYISYATAVSTVAMVVRIVETGQKNTYLNGQSQSYHLRKGVQTIVLKIGKKNYNRTIIIPDDNSPVRISAIYTGRRAEIAIDQPNVSNNDPIYRDSQQIIQQSQRKIQSPLAIISFVLSLLVYTSPIGLILAIIDLIRSKHKNDNEYAHGLSVAGLVIGSVVSVVIMLYSILLVLRYNTNG